MADGAFWNNPMTTEDWDLPALAIPRDAPSPRPRSGDQTHMTATQWLNQQYERGFPKHPG